MTQGRGGHLGGRGQETSTVEDFLQVGLWSHLLPPPRVPDGCLGPKLPSRCEWGFPLAPGWVPGSNRRASIRPTGVRTGAAKVRVGRSIPPPRPHSHLSLKAHPEGGPRSLPFPGVDRCQQNQFPVGGAVGEVPRPVTPETPLAPCSVLCLRLPEWMPLCTC